MLYFVLSRLFQHVSCSQYIRILEYGLLQSDMLPCDWPHLPAALIGIPVGKYRILQGVKCTQAINDQICDDIAPTVQWLLPTIVLTITLTPLMKVYFTPIWIGYSGWWLLPLPLRCPATKGHRQPVRWPCGIIVLSFSDQTRNSSHFIYV